MKNLLHSCAKVHEPIDLSFGLVNGIGSGIGVLDGVHVPQKLEVSGGFRPLSLE